MRIVPILLLCSACSSGGDDAGKAKLASDLVTCKNEKNAMRDELAEAKAALKKAQDQLEANSTVKLDGVEVKGSLPGGGGGGRRMEGNIPPEAVVKVVRQNSSGFKVCYEHALKRKPDLQFVQSVTARFLVRNVGVASDVSFVPHTDAEMEHCMAAAMEKWHFPQFQGEPVKFEFPISLVSK